MCFEFNSFKQNVKDIIVLFVYKMQFTIQAVSNNIYLTGVYDTREWCFLASPDWLVRR